MPDAFSSGKHTGIGLSEKYCLSVTIRKTPDLRCLVQSANEDVPGVS